MNKSFALLAIIATIAAGPLAAMHYGKYTIPCRHDDYASRAPEKHRLLRQDTGLSWQNGLSFDLAEMLGGYLHSVGDKKNVRLVCKHWHEQFRHPGQSYGNGVHCPAVMETERDSLGTRIDNLSKCLDRLVQRINQRPHARKDDSLEITIHNTQYKCSVEFLEFFRQLEDLGLSSIIKALDITLADFDVKEFFLFLHSQRKLEKLRIDVSCKTDAEASVQLKQLEGVAIAEQCNRSLTSLNLYCRKGIIPQFYRQLCNRAPNLKKLKIVSCPRGNNEQIIEQLQQLHHLKKLTIGPDFLPALLHKKINLTTLCIYNFDWEGILLEIGEENALADLINLEISMLCTLTAVRATPVLEALFSAFPQVRNLKVAIPQCPPSHAFLECIATSLPHLQCLTLTYPQFIGWALPTRMALAWFNWKHPNIAVTVLPQK